MNLSKYTVKELREIALRMGVPMNSRTVKAELINLISTQIEKDYIRAIEDEAFRNESIEPTYTIPGTDMTLKGDLARVMIYHMSNVHRFNPTEKRDKNNRVILTPKQQRRCAKKLRKYTYKTLSVSA